MLDLYDKDRDGLLSITDVGFAIRTLGYSPTVQEVADMVSEMEIAGPVSLQALLVTVARQAGRVVSDDDDDKLRTMIYDAVQSAQSALPISEKELSGFLRTVGEDVNSDFLRSLVKTINDVSPHTVCPSTDLEVTTRHFALPVLWGFKLLHREAKRRLLVQQYGPHSLVAASLRAKYLSSWESKLRDIEAEASLKPTARQQDEYGKVWRRIERMKYINDCQAKNVPPAQSGTAPLMATRCQRKPKKRLKPKQNGCSCKGDTCVACKCVKNAFACTSACHPGKTCKNKHNHLPNTATASRLSLPIAEDPVNIPNLNVPFPSSSSLRPCGLTQDPRFLTTEKKKKTESGRSSRRGS